jgi:hypothetical protein
MKYSVLWLRVIMKENMNALLENTNNRISDVL